MTWVFFGISSHWSYDRVHNDHISVSSRPILFPSPFNIVLFTILRVVIKMVFSYCGVKLPQAPYIYKSSDLSNIFFFSSIFFFFLRILYLDCFSFPVQSLKKAWKWQVSYRIFSGSPVFFHWKKKLTTAILLNFNEIFLKVMVYS